MFEHLGYFKEYYINHKFIGALPCEYDGREIGYCGSKKEVLTETIEFKNKKKIKQGSEVTTLIYPLCGKSIKPKI